MGTDRFPMGVRIMEDNKRDFLPLVSCRSFPLPRLA